MFPVRTSPMAVRSLIALGAWMAGLVVGITTGVARAEPVRDLGAASRMVGHWTGSFEARGVFALLSGDLEQVSRRKFSGQFVIDDGSTLECSAMGTISRRNQVKLVLSCPDRIRLQLKGRLRGEEPATLEGPAVLRFGKQRMRGTFMLTR